MEHLEKALRIHPDYLEAQNNLGICYVKLGQYDRAVAVLERARALDPKSREVQQNLHIAQVLRSRAFTDSPSVR